MRREARRIGVRVSVETAPLRDPADRLTTALLPAVRLVRAAPALLAWFGSADVATTAALAHSDEVIESLGCRAVGDHDTARWIVRVIVSLLIVPGRDDDEERAIVQRYVVPTVLGTR